MTYLAEPEFRHGAPTRVGVLAVNLGTPQAPTEAALRTYLAEFLNDPRVVEISRIVWKAVLHGVILRTRPAKSAKKYAAIWTSDGSPLLVWSRRQAIVLQGMLGERCKSAGFTDHLTKPVNLQKLEAAIQRLGRQDGGVPTSNQSVDER